MKRRSFIKTSTATSAALMLNGIPVMASGTGNTVFSEMALRAAANGKSLVIIQLNGGNDGLNTIFPLDQWDNLYNARTNILMNKSSVLTLDKNLTTGLHPAMADLQSLYNNGKMMIVQGVSYPNPSFSHFRATDIWFTASGSNQVLDSGWLGRALDTMFPGFPNGYPNDEMTDPLAIQIGSTLPFSLMGPTINLGYNVSSPSSLLNVINKIADPAPDNDYGRELTFLRMMKDQSNDFREVIQNAYNTNLSFTPVYPDNNKLADQLKIVAKLINGGLKTCVYIVNHPNSFDLHENQVSSTDRATGTHATILGLMSQAVGAFQKDIEMGGKNNNVTTITFSEFGRRMKSNASNGTDHGTAAPVMIFGSTLNTNPTTVSGTAYPVPGMIGVSPVIPQSVTVNNQVPMQFDFRQIYTTIMQDWYGMSESQSDNVLGGKFTKLPIFNKTMVSAIDFDNPVNDFVRIYPNPVIGETLNIHFNENIYGKTKITLFSINGSKLDSKVMQVNGNTVSFLSGKFTSGLMYIVEIEYNNHYFYKKVVCR